jgi:hypothetical protein
MRPWPVADMMTSSFGGVVGSAVGGLARMATCLCRRARTGTTASFSLVLHMAPAS